MEIPGYKLVDTLGEGSLATVYLAVGDRLEREVALKLVKPEICSDPVFAESFLYRARLLGEFEHPHIIKVFDAGQEAHGCYLAMAYIAGRTLRHRRFELHLREQLAVVKDVAEALDYAHSQGCDHGRLNPDNIMLRDRDHGVIVTDFVMGSAPLIGAEQRCYLSPEQRRGLPGDHRSDLYSLGAILLLLLWRQAPLEEPAAEPQEEQEAGAAEGGKADLASKSLQWTLPEGLAVFQPIIERALAPDPRDRYQSGAELIAALNAITETQLEAAARAGALASLQRGEIDKSSEATAYALSAERELPESEVPENAAPPSKAAEPAESPSELETSPVAEGGQEKVAAEESLLEPDTSLPEAGGPSGALRVWARDRIDSSLESEPPSWWLVAFCGLAALLLVGAIVLAAVLD